MSPENVASLFSKFLILRTLSTKFKSIITLKFEAKFNLKDGGLAVQEEWTAEAEKAINLCQDWAKAALTDISGRLYLFGSVIYRGGIQFNTESSDLDLVYVFPHDLSAIARFEKLKKLREHKIQLELRMIPALNRTTCDEAGVSVVPTTEFELECNIHKSGARSFFDKNFFYDLIEKNQHIGLKDVGIRSLPDEHRQAIEFVQKVRNDYLSVSANDSGGIKEYSGSDPLPKSLLRSAAQLAPDIDITIGDWYDTRSGLEFLYSILVERRSQDHLYKLLFDKISVRRGGRGKVAPLTDDDQLLLAEILFDVASNVKTEEMVTWEIRIDVSPYSEESVKRAFSEVQRIIPDAKLISSRPGSVILRIRSSRSSFSLLEELQNLTSLAKLIKAEVRALAVLSENESQQLTPSESKLDLLVKLISGWSPPPDINGVELEAHFEHFLLHEMRATPAMGEWYLESTPYNYERFAPDFCVNWTDRSQESIDIEVVRLKTFSAFYDKIARLRLLGRTTIVVLVAKKRILSHLSSDISRLKNIAGDIFVVPVLLSDISTDANLSTLSDIPKLPGS